MLFALRQPTTLLGLLLGFAAGCYLRATLQRLVNGGSRALTRGGLRAASSPRLWLDPYGCVAALLCGVGWSPRPALPHRTAKRSVWLLTAVAVVVHAANFGVRPMYQIDVPLMEAHLFDFDGDLYGKHLSVELVAYIRPEAKFDGVPALIAQIGADARAARDILARTPKMPELDGFPPHC